jgi:hypothetical protein
MVAESERKSPEIKGGKNFETEYSEVCPTCIIEDAPSEKDQFGSHEGIGPLFIPIPPPPINLKICRTVNIVSVGGNDHGIALGAAQVAARITPLHTVGQIAAFWFTVTKNIGSRTPNLRFERVGWVSETISNQYRTAISAEHSITLPNPRSGSTFCMF